MNPINDEMPAKDGNDEKSQDLIKSIKLSSKSSDNNEKSIDIIQKVDEEKLKETEKTQISGQTNIPENTNDTNEKEQLNSTESEKTNENDSNSTYTNDKEDTDACRDKLQDVDGLVSTSIEGENQKIANDEMNDFTKDTNTKQDDTASETGAEEDNEQFEDVEDDEISDEEVEEIIVPDEAEAEDLTDDKDEINKSLNEDEYEELRDEEGEETLKDSEGDDNEIENSLHDEETTKSSAAVEKDDNEISLIEDDSDKKSLNNNTQEDTCSRDYEETAIDSLHIEPELVAIEENMKDIDSPKSNEKHLDENTTSPATIFDPLNCTDNQEQSKDDADNESDIIIRNENSSHTNENEEDDEVQFIETRNSPICIESDEDDVDSKDTTETSASLSNNSSENIKQTITTATATVNVPKNLIVTRTSARKSTAKPPQIQQATSGKNSPNTVPKLQKKPKFLNYLQKATNYKRSSVGPPNTQRVVDCIDLLDSSDEESTATHKQQQQQFRTPQKRTLLAAKGNYYKTNNKMTNSGSNRLPTNFPSHMTQQVKKPAPPPLPPPTPQSNFLNAVQLQPASVSGSNPPAFSALLSNKSVIIPNAFYGNPPSVRVSADIDIERRYARWLDNFLNLFCKPQFVATHSCFVFLQRALKYKDFVRIKTLRTNMNSHGQIATNNINTILMADLRTIFFKNAKRITNNGRRFCELTCTSTPGKAVALMSHGISGKVTLKTCNMDITKSTNPAVSSTSMTSHGSTNSLMRKRQLEDDEDEYTPDKSKLKTKAKPPSENGDEDSGEVGDDRKRSLRTKRTKRLDNSFSYNEDDLVAEYEIDDADDEKLAQIEIQRKIEQKRLEAQKQRQQQVKSFESAFIQAFTKPVEGPTTSKTSKKVGNAERIRLKNATATTATSVRQYTANNDAEDLLQATWIENLENDDTQIISDDDEPKEHRIYKQQQQKLQQQTQKDYYSPSTKLPTRNSNNPSSKNSNKTPRRREQEEIITGDDDYEENNFYSNNPSNIDPDYWPKNVDLQMHVHGKHKDRCVICNLSCQRLVHHYVNEHRGCEVYNSRMSSSQLKLLKQGNCTNSNVSLYKNGQFQYEAFCIFCQKQSRFMLPYWYQHFTMHTGEYAYRCSGCGIRKPTRSLLTQHQTQGCPDMGGVIQDYAHDPKSSQIEARICTLCNYVQLHRCNIVKHLHTQHNIKQILPKHIQTIVLMKTKATLSPATPMPTPTSSPSSSSSGSNKRVSNVPTHSRPSSSNPQNTYIIDDDDNDDDADDGPYEEIIPGNAPPQTNVENNYYNYIPPYMQAAVNSGNFSFEEVDAGDDLSFMICGMLDVQMNTDTN